MVGTGIRKFGATFGLNIVKGAVIGNYKGYYINLDEGMGYKRITVSAFLKDKADLINLIEQEIRLIGNRYIFSFRSDTYLIEVIFNDQLGLMKKFNEVLDKVVDKLAENKVPGSDYCPVCGEKINSKANSVASLPSMILPIHNDCFITVNVSNWKKEIEINGNRSYVKGFFGALLGALIFSIPLIVVYLLGYIASLVALIIGIGSNLGYKYLGGKYGKSKMPIIIIGMIIGLVVSVFTSYCLELYLFSEIEGIMLSDTPFVFIEAMLTVPEYSDAIIGQSLQIAFFSFAGIVGYFSYLNKQKLIKY